MRFHAAVCLLLAASVFLCVGAKDYHGSHVFDIEASNEEQVEFLRDCAKEFGLMVLREPSLVRSADFVVPAEKREAVKNALRSAGLSFTEQTADLQDQINEERGSIVASRRASTRNQEFLPDHSRYYNLEEINRFLKNFADTYSDLVVLKTMDHRTHEGRSVYYLEIGAPTGDPSKPVIFIEGLTHAREWAGGSSVLYVIEDLLRGYGDETRPLNKKVLDKYTWVIVPVVNPDGYAYTWSEDRMWRKNRRPFNSPCTGVDLNRNYDVEWGTTGVTFDCASDIYPGDAPFSEPETRNIRDLFLRLKPRVKAFLSVHAFSQLLLYPWGFVDSTNNTVEPPNINELKEVGSMMAELLPRYELGTAVGVLGYGASGASEDWALWEKPGILSYTYEMRPKTVIAGHFLLDKKYIIPTGQELMSSLFALAQNIRD